MSCELIKVDFKTSKVKSRAVLTKAGEPWVAVKDKEFKDFVSGIAALAEAAEKMGGDWRRMMVIMQDKPAGKEEYCMTLRDEDLVSHADAEDVLGFAMSKIYQDRPDGEKE